MTINAYQPEDYGLDVRSSESYRRGVAKLAAWHEECAHRRAEAAGVKLPPRKKVKRDKGEAHNRRRK